MSRAGQKKCSGAKWLKWRLMECEESRKLKNWRGSESEDRVQLSAHFGKTLKEDEGDYTDFNIDQMQITRCSVAAYGMELHGKQSTLMAAPITCLRMRVQELHQSLICQGGLPVHTGIAPHMTKKAKPSNKSNVGLNDQQAVTKSSAGQNTFSRPSRNPINFWFNVPVFKSLTRISSLLDMCFDAKSRTSSELLPPLIIITRGVHCRLLHVVGKWLYSLRVLQTQPAEGCISRIRDVICKTARSSVWTALIESIKCKCFGGSSWIFSVFLEKWKERIESMLLWNL